MLTPLYWWSLVFHFLFNDTATTEIYTLSLHDALPIFTTRVTRNCPAAPSPSNRCLGNRCTARACCRGRRRRSEEHTSELQSRQYLVCRLLLEKKNNRVMRPLRQHRKRKLLSSRHLPLT